MSRRSYADMASELGLELCTGPPRYPRCQANHDLGSHDRKIHLSPRRVTERGTKWFLRLAVMLLHPEYAEDAPWRRVYRSVLAERELAAQLHVRIGREYYDMDRAFVLAGVASIPNSEPMRKQAFDWARR